MGMSETEVSEMLAGQFGSLSIEELVGRLGALRQRLSIDRGVEPQKSRSW